MPQRNDSFFGNNIEKRLAEPLAKEHILEREAYKGGPKLSYLPAHHIINTANDIFGFGMWSTEIIHLQQADKTEDEKAPYNAGEKPKASPAIACEPEPSSRA